MGVKDIYFWDFVGIVEEEDFFIGVLGMVKLGGFGIRVVGGYFFILREELF